MRSASEVCIAPRHEFVAGLRRVKAVILATDETAGSRLNPLIHCLRGILVVPLGRGGAALGFFVAEASARVSKGAGLGGGLVLGICVALLIQALGQTYASSATTAPDPISPATVSQTRTTNEPVESAQPTEEPSPEGTPTDDGPVTTPADDPTTDDTATSSGNSRYYLARVQRIEEEKEGRVGGCTGGCTGFRAGSGRIGGSVFPQSFLMGVDSGGRRSIALWNSVNSCSSLNANVGLDDSSGNAQVTFTVSKNGDAPIELATTSVGEAQSIETSLEGVAQFELAAYVSGPKVTSDVKVVWGDEVMTCEPGSITGG